MKLSVSVLQPQPPLMPLLQQVHRLPARGRLLFPSGSPLGRAVSLALAHVASGLPRLSIACAQCQALAVKRQDKKRRPSEGGRIEIKPPKDFKLTHCPSLPSLANFQRLRAHGPRAAETTRLRSFDFANNQRLTTNGPATKKAPLSGAGPLTLLRAES